MKLNHVIRLMALLILLSVFAVALLEIRITKASSTLHKGFEWNLFLAWIPLFISFITYLLHRKIKLHFLLFSIGFTLWLLFFLMRLI